MRSLRDTDCMLLKLTMLYSVNFVQAFTETARGQNVSFSYYCIKGKCDKISDTEKL